MDYDNYIKKYTTTGDMTSSPKRMSNGFINTDDLWYCTGPPSGPEESLHGRDTDVYLRRRQRKEAVVKSSSEIGCDVIIDDLDDEFGKSSMIL